MHKTCPFCGGRPKYETTQENGFTCGYIRCIVCGVRTRWYQIVEEEDKKRGLTWCLTKEELYNKWDRRA